MTTETGPIYGTPLITSLQVSNDGWIQKMPSRADLQWCQDAMSYRVAAGYEVLLAHYNQVCEERDRLRGIMIEIGEWWDGYKMLPAAVAERIKTEIAK